MSLVKFLEKLIMLCLGLMKKTAIIAFPVSGVLIVMFIISSDEFLNRHVFLSSFLTVLLSFTCCLLTLSRICILRRKSYAEKITIGQLCDADMMYENETEEVPFNKLSFHCKDIRNTLKNLIFRNPYEFSKFRPAYGLLLAFGFIFSFAIAVAVIYAKEWNNKDDIYCVAVELTVPMVLMISVIYFIANMGVYVAEKDCDLYFPFEEFVQIPLKSLVGKTVAVFVTSGVTHWILTVLTFSITALPVISSNYGSEVNDILKSLLTPIYPDPQRLISAILVLIITSCVSALIWTIFSSFFEVKNSILCVIEKNWQRNLVAISYLLPDVEFGTLKDLKDALDHKRSLPLTEKEISAFKYIGLPIWRTKQPFMIQKFKKDDSEPVPFDKQETEHPQQPDDATEPKLVVEPERMEPTHVAQAVVHEAVEPMTSEQLDETVMMEESISEEPTASASCQNVVE